MSAAELDEMAYLETRIGCVAELISEAVLEIQKFRRLCNEAAQ